MGPAHGAHNKQAQTSWMEGAHDVRGVGGQKKARQALSSPAPELFSESAEGTS